MRMSCSCRDYDLAPLERGVLESSARQLERFFHRIVRLEWKLQASGGTHLARCRLHSRSGYYGALGSGPDTGRAVRDALRKLVVQRRRRKAARTRARRATRRAVPTKVQGSLVTAIASGKAAADIVHEERALVGGESRGVVASQQEG